MQVRVQVGVRVCVRVYAGRCMCACVYVNVRVCECVRVQIPRAAAPLTTKSRVSQGLLRPTNLRPFRRET